MPRPRQKSWLADPSADEKTAKRSLFFRCFPLFLWDREEPTALRHEKSQFVTERDPRVHNDIIRHIPLSI
jgi:hypothetical protein